MRFPNERQIERLTTESDGPYVSIYMPTHRCGAETLQDPIRLKNLTKEAEHQLQACGCAIGVIDTVLRPVVELIGDYDFWQHQADGLLVFCGKELFETYGVDVAVPELCVVGGRPHLLPMLSLLALQAPFFVLRLSQSQVKLLKGTRDGLTEVEVEGMPCSLNDIWNTDTEAGNLQAHSASPAGLGHLRSTVYHGQGSGDEAVKERLHDYCHRIDKAIRPVLSGEGAPLILAAVEYVGQIYRQESSCSWLQDRGVAGNPDYLSIYDLHARALPIAVEYFDAERRKAADRYLELWSTQRVSNEVARVLPAAACGRVDSVFAAAGEQIWGRYSAASGLVDVSDSPCTDLEELLNLTAIYAYRNGAAVYSVPLSQVPGGGPVAAVFRY